MNLRGLLKFSLLDFPGRISCVAFVGNCDFRCSYCNNPSLVFDPEAYPLITEEAFFAFLETRRGKLDGVVISGGEPSLRDRLPNFIARVKDMGFAVKIDTNGAHPEMVEALIATGRVDFFAVDYKAPAERYRHIVGVGDSDILSARVRATLENIARSHIRLEVRTTVHKAILSLDDLRQMRRELDSYGVGAWVLQQFHPAEIICEELKSLPTYSDTELDVFAHSLPRTSARGLGRRIQQKQVETRRPQSYATVTTS